LAGLPDSQALRSALDHHHRPGGCRGGDDSGVATRPIADMDAYRRSCASSSIGVASVCARCSRPPSAGSRNAHRLLRRRGRAHAARRPDHHQRRSDAPILIGRPDVIATRLKRIGSKLRRGPISRSSTRPTMSATRNAGRPIISCASVSGVTIDIAKTRLRSNNTIIGAMLLRLGYADGMICGLSGRFGHHLRQLTRSSARRRAADDGGDDASPAAWPRALPLRHARQ
jgi:malate dehydrogenase (oxaloacetate-decarboxylating)(NADP+)